MNKPKQFLTIFMAGICVLHTPMSVFASKDLDFTAQVYRYGPGEDNLSASDAYAHYQWGLRNDGDLEYVEIVNKFQKSNPDAAELIDFSNAFHLELPDELNGPHMYHQESTRAKKGMDINIQPAWAQYDADTQTHRQVTVAVLDTGVDITHPDLKNSIWVNEDEIAGDGIDNDGNGYIDDVNGWNFFSDSNEIYVDTEADHGTHAAGTIAAARGTGGIAGIADPNYVKIMPLKVLGTQKGKGAEEDIIRAIQYAEANGASICNISFGTDEYYPTLEKVMKNSSMLFIVSAGNGDAKEIGIDLDTSNVKDYPCCFQLDNMISVANLMFDGNLHESSNYGANTVDIAAPGTYILSLSSHHGYGYMSGTSMAAPMVTGIAAMVYSYRPEFTLADVKTAILNSARKRDSMNGKIKSGGIADAYAAMNYGK